MLHSQIRLNYNALNSTLTTLPSMQPGCLRKVPHINTRPHNIFVFTTYYILPEQGRAKAHR